MGFFASLFSQKTSPAPRSAAPAAPHRIAPAAGPLPDQPGFASPPAGPHQPEEIDAPALLLEARTHLDRKDLPAALQLYERIAQDPAALAASLAAISGDLGATGHIEALIEFLAPRYEPAAHGLPAGLNLLQAYLHRRDPVAAQQLLDLLEPLVTTYSMRDRLDGFRCAILALRTAEPAEAAPPSAEAPDVELISISKPIWSYALPDADNILPTKNPHARRLGLMPIALVGDGVPANAFAAPDHPQAALVRGLPLALAEACWFVPAYRPIATTGLAPDKNLLLSPRTFRGEQIRQLFPKDKEPLDFALAGTIQAAPGGTVAAAEFTIWDLRKTKPLKTLRAEGPDAITRLWPQLLGYLEAAKPGTAPIPYALPADPVAHAVALDHVLHFFLAEKKVLAAEKLSPHAPRLAALADYARAQPQGVAPRLAFLAALHHSQALELEIPPAVAAVAAELAAAS